MNEHGYTCLHSLHTLLYVSKSPPGENVKKQERGTTLLDRANSQTKKNNFTSN